MKKYEALYDWPIAQIEILADSAEAEAYSSTLGEGALDEFVEITEKLREQSAALYQGKASRQHCSAWAETRKLVDTFAERFAAFPNVQLPKIRLFLLLCDVAAQLAPDLDGDDIAERLFQPYGVSPSLPGAWFAHQNGRAFEGSVVFVKPSELQAIEEALFEESASPWLLFHLLATLSSSDAQLPDAVVFLKSASRETKDVEAYLKLHLLMGGRLVHVPKTIKRVPAVVDRDAADVDVGYGQWNDQLMVLSEYNSRDESLLKFLTLYQVFEGLMFKCPIVKLERAKNGEMFSLREFKALYSSVSVNELSALEGLFKSVFSLPMGGSTVKEEVEAAWADLEQRHSAPSIEQEVLRLGVKFGGPFIGANSASNLAKIVYIVRNSVVHNKETEFHLTSDSLTAALCAIVEDFLLPTLEKIIFHVISRRNDQVWYASQQLVLY